MNILSLFDGKSCGQIALNRAGIPYDNYYASEIDKYAIKVTQANYPKTIQLGDIKKIECSKLPKIDVLIGGSPCQGFSFAGKELNFNDPRSALFFEYVRILNEVRPKYFLLENVVMKKQYQDIITSYLKVEPILIDSGLVSAQSRKRLYWTNIPNVTIPENKKIYLSDIIEDDFKIGARMVGRRLNNDGIRKDYDKSIPIVQYIEINSTNKSNCLTTVQKDNILIKEIFKSDNRKNSKLMKINQDFRYFTPNEYERLQTVPENYTGHVPKAQRYKMLGNGWTIDVISHIFKNLKENK